MNHKHPSFVRPVWISEVVWIFKYPWGQALDLFQIFNISSELALQQEQKKNIWTQNPHATEAILGLG